MHQFNDPPKPEIGGGDCSDGGCGGDSSSTGGNSGEVKENDGDEEFKVLLYFEAVMKEAEACGVKLPLDMVEAVKTIGIRKNFLQRIDLVSMAITAENVEAIVLRTYDEAGKELSAETLSQMSGLKLLILPKGNFSGSLHFLSNELGYLDWKEYPFTYLPSNFQPNKLVKLILKYSNIKELWEGIKDLHNLTHMELCHSKNLVKIPNLSQSPNLEHLDLEGCVKLVHLDASTGSLEKLHFLNLKNCRSLVSIPNSIFCLNSLYDLNLSGCKRLFKYQLLEKSRQSEQLNAGQSVERHMTSSIRKTLSRPLQFLSSRRRANSVGLLVPSVSRFPALVNMQCPLIKCKFEVVIPGNEIPRWFKKQNTGDSVILDPSHILDDNNWIGIACCGTFVAHHAPTQLFEETIESQDLISFGFRCTRSDGNIYSRVPICLKKDLITTEVDHMLLSFISREVFINFYASHIKEGASDLHGIKLHAASDYPEEVVEVKSCGYRWVFKEDLEQFNPTMMYSANSSAQSPKHKSQSANIEEIVKAVTSILSPKPSSSLSNDIAAENLEAIVLPRFHQNREEMSERTTLRVEALSQMRHLKLLILREANFLGCPNFLSNELGYLDWKDYPFTCLPSSFQPNKLVKLILHYSNIKELWEGIKDLHNLTYLELCHSKNLVKIPNLSHAPNLEYINLKGCVKLVYLDASIGSLEKLLHLNLENCKNLVSIPNSIFHLNSLRNLNLSGCWKLLKYQLLEKPRESKQLNTGQSVQSHMTTSICKTLMRPLNFLSSRRRSNSVGLLVPTLSRFPALVFLDISFCNLVQIPDAIGQLRCLQWLNIGGNNFVTPPDCIKELPKLRVLNLEYCKHLKLLPSTFMPIGGSSGRYYYGGIYVFNCPNLSDTEGCRLTVISWMIKMIQVNLQCRIQAVVPGTKIPRWFSKQKTGDSVSLDPSPIVDDNNWIGIAVCVTFVVHHTPTQLLEEAIYPPALIACGFRRKGYRGSYPHVPIRLKNDLITAELDHMLLIFVSREDFLDENTRIAKEGTSDLHGITLHTISDYPEEVVELKRCGYRWVFKEDLEQFNPTMMFSANSSAQSPNHKSQSAEIKNIVKVVTSIVSPKPSSNLSDDIIAENLEAIVLRQCCESREELPVEALSQMSNLKLLIFRDGNLNFSGCLHFLSNELGYLEWEKYPCTCLPSSFQPNKLVKLILPHSNMKELWKGIKDLPNLTHIALKGSDNLVKIPNLSQAPNLEELNLEGCVKLVHLDPSVGSLQKLRFLNLKCCKSLVKIPILARTPNLEKLNLAGCDKLVQLDASVGSLQKLHSLNLNNCKSLVKIPILARTPNLEKLNLEGCDKLVHLDASIGSLEKLRFMNLENCKNLVSIPNSIFHLNSLDDLNLSGCWKLFKYQLLENPRQSEQLNSGQSVQSHMTSSICKTLTRPLHFLSSRRRSNSVGSLVPSLSRFPVLTSLDISFCNLVQIPEAIGQLHCLEYLNIGGNNIVALPHCIKELPKLTWLNLEYCKHLKGLPSTLLPIRRVYRGGIYVFNCPNLSDTESCGVTVISWMIKMIQVNLQCSFPKYSIRAVVPGSKIPRWFSEQNADSSIRLDPSPILDDNNWIGIAVCGTFVAHHASPQFVRRETGSLLECVFSRSFYLSVHYDVPIRFKQDLIATELDHVFLMFCSRENIIDFFSEVLKEGPCCRDGCELAIESDYPEVVEVKSVGYRWVFKEDVEQLNPTMMYGANSSSRHNQKHKFLAIQDEQLM
ncbi:hypothetical protein Ahy_A03g016392 isoform C [Arachis hypogaea]|uniref:C-JID domain-containing protein n=1 Tax=Arachis hypogaea TaxID=3818 RepID=A0A445E349_ARAHY|nr:hypothetical protein Ahy_A03g016392 isoform C [Arachis hypogaea]